MPRDIDLIKQKIIERHNDDKKQLEVVFSPSSRLLVEAPAGYGKTKTMVSRIAFMLATGQIPHPKKMLALTFSVNAAYKIKKDVAQQIPELLKNTDISIDINDKILVSNYHGFCRNVLKKHGYRIHQSLLAIDTLESVDDSDPRKIMGLVNNLTSAEAALLTDYNKAIKAINASFVKDNLESYCNIIINKILPAGMITFNGILALTIYLFGKVPFVKDFYHKYFSAILVDEYQDTNIVSFWLVTQLVTENTKTIFLGDSLQRIYGFIGAVPNLLSKSEDRFKLTRISLNKNYRFSSNPEMLKLDLNIRRNAENPYSPIIPENAKVNFDFYKDQNDEGLGILSKAQSLLSNSPTSKIVILVKQRGSNVDKIMEIFENGNVPFFYGLFTDEDFEYVKFHKECLSTFQELSKEKGQITKKIGAEHLKKIRDIYKDKDNQTLDALINLLNIFWSRVFVEFAFLANQDKVVFIKDTFEHNGLKQYIEFVNTNITFSTVHAAKGLEWDYVLIPDIEQDSFPNWFGLCGECSSKSDCIFKVTKENEQKFLEELSVFYVAVTRAKKHVFFSASSSQLDKNGVQRIKRKSCFLSLPGIITG